MRIDYLINNKEENIKFHELSSKIYCLFNITSNYLPHNLFSSELKYTQFADITSQKSNNAFKPKIKEKKISGSQLFSFLYLLHNLPPRPLVPPTPTPTPAASSSSHPIHPTRPQPPLAPPLSSSLNPHSHLLFFYSNLSVSHFSSSSSLLIFSSFFSFFKTPFPLVKLKKV